MVTQVAPAAAVLICALLGGCSEQRTDRAEANSAGRQAPVLLFAVDGLDWSVLLPMVQRGEVPTFANLMERGVFGVLRSFVPSWSPVIWTTIATGKSPDKHGITGFVYKLPTADGLEPRPFTSGHRRTKAFWNILSDAGLTVDVIGWWVTYPAEPVRGLMVSQTNTTAARQPNTGVALRKGSLQPGVGGQVWPRESEPAVLATLSEVEAGLPEIVGELFGTPQHPLGELEQVMWDQSLWAFRADETYLRIARERLAKPPSTLTAVYLGETDVVGHRFWWHAFPEQFEHRPSADQVENFGGLLEATYRRADRALSDLLARMPDDTTVFVVSDHGMQAKGTDGVFSLSAKRPDRLSGMHRPFAVLIAAGSGIRATGATPEAIRALGVKDLRQLGSVVDVLPTLLVMLGIPVGEDMDGHPLSELIDPQLLAERPPRRIPTHDTPQWLREHEAFRIDSRDLEERLEQLRALGYVH